jgi:uncharacterized protein (DUF488 family)
VVRRPTVWTIGHSNRTLDEFVSLLTGNGIDVLVDVRSAPHSRRFPHFGKSALTTGLRHHGIDYRWRGDRLGARHEDPALLDAEGTVDFARVAGWGPFRSELANLLREARRGERIALCCAERDPLDCHRAVLVARRLAVHAGIRHIFDADRVDTHAEFEERILRRAGIGDAQLFEDRGDRLARAYHAVGRRIAWRASG